MRTTKHSFIKEVFENYGYIDLDTVEPENKEFQSFLKSNFIKTKIVTLASRNVGGYDEIRYTGTYSSLLKMLEKHFDEDFAFLDEFFKRQE